MWLSIKFCSDFVVSLDLYPTHKNEQRSIFSVHEDSNAKQIAAVKPRGKLVQNKHYIY